MYYSWALSLQRIQQVVIVATSNNYKGLLRYCGELEKERKRDLEDTLQETFNLKSVCTLNTRMKFYSQLNALSEVLLAYFLLFLVSWLVSHSILLCWLKKKGKSEKVYS
jgi:hypothetical protein